METLLALALIMAMILWWAARKNELFLISVRDGELLVVRGRVPQGLLADYRPLLRHVKRGSIVAKKTSDGALLQMHGIDDNDAQRLRNVLGLRSPAQQINGAPIRNPSLGQRLGITWLAWRCNRHPHG